MNNNYHRYLKAPFEIEKPVEFHEQPFCAKHLLLSHLKNLEIDIWFKSLGLKCGFKEAFFTPPKGKIPIHTDLPEITNHVKINITWGPKEGEIIWWNCSEPEKKFISAKEKSAKYEDVKDKDELVKPKNKNELIEPNSNGYVEINGVVGHSKYHHHNLWYKEENSEIVYRANTNKLSLVNVGVPHSTYNPTDEGRWTLCFGVHDFNGDRVHWDKALEKFDFYIEKD